MHFGNFQIINIYVVTCLEKRCHKIIEPKLNDTRCVFFHGSTTTDQISLSSKFLRNLGSMPKTSAHALPALRKHNDCVPCEKLWEVLREYNVESHLLLAFKSLHSSSEVCIHVGKIKSQHSPLVLESDKGVSCHHSFS